MKHALLLLSLIAIQAQAQIIYTDVIPDATYNVSGDTCFLDLDNNGEADFKLSQLAVPAYCDTCLLTQPELRVNVFPVAPEIIPGDIIVQLAPGVDASTIVTDCAELDGQPTGLRVVRELSKPMRAWLLHHDVTDIDHEALVRLVRRHPGITIAQSNRVVKLRSTPNDPLYGSMWHHGNIDSEAAWDITTGGVTANGDTIVVCIVESADMLHPDLIGNAWFNHQEIPGNGIDDDGNGYVDDYRGWNPFTNNDDVYGYNNNGYHGTLVAGMAGAKGDNNTGIAGANWNVELMVVTLDDLFFPTEAGVIASYTYPWEMRRLYNNTGGAQGAFVVATNSSWGLDNADPLDFPLWCALYDSLGAVGVLSCGATVNANVDIDVVGDMPTGCTSEYMVSVTATNNVDQRTFSAYGLTTIDLGAPGENVWTTGLGGGYGPGSGTSFASPLTAGVIALLYSAPCPSLMDLVQSDPALGALYVRDALFSGVEQVGNLPGTCVTGGRVNSYNSLQLIMDNCATCPAPYGVVATDVDSNTVVLTWQVSGVDTFNLQYRPVGMPGWTALGQQTPTGFTLGGLTACTEYEFQVESVCDGLGSEFTSFFFTSDGCCSAPDNLSIGIVESTSANVAWDPLTAALSYEAQFSAQGSGNWTVVTGITNAIVELTGLDSCTTYDIQVRTVCTNGTTDWSDPSPFTTRGCGSCQDLPYCPSACAGITDQWITGVQVGTLNNQTGSNGGYSDFTSTALSTDLEIGAQNQITLKLDYYAGPWNGYFKVYIDLDHDGDFTGPGERVNTATIMTQDSITATIDIPTGAMEGSTRMRVLMLYGTNNFNSCTNNYPSGETEDYCVNLVNNTTGVGESPTAGQLHVFPNPFTSILTVSMGMHKAGVVTCTVRALTGQALLTRTVAPTGGPSTFTLDLGSLASGIYLLEMQVDGERIVRKVVKE